MKTKKLISVCLSLALVLSTTACSAKPGNITPTPQSKDEFALRVGIMHDPEVIDPATAITINSQTFIDYLFEGLVRYEHGDKEAAIIQMGQAKRFSESDDGLTYRFELRDDIFWSDGKPVVAEDYVYSWQRLVDPKTDSSYGSLISMVVNATEILAGEKSPSELGVRAIDEKTFEVKLTQKFPYFIDLCAIAPTYPVRKDVVEANGIKWYATPETIITNGAYTLETWEPDDKLVLSKNEKYYDAKTIGPDRLDFTVVGDPIQALSLFTNNQLDVLFDIDKSITSSMRGTEQLTEFPALGLRMIHFNNQKSPFDNANVRRAFSLAINRDTLVGEQSDYDGTPLASLVPFGMTDAATGTDFRKNKEYYFSVKTEDYAANCDEAKKLLAAAGFENGKNFPNVRFVFSDTDSETKQAEILTKAWEDVLGVKVEAVPLPRIEWQNESKTHNFDITLSSWIADYNDPTTFLNVYESTSTNNDISYHNPEYDAALANAVNATTPQERFAALHKAEDILMNDDAIAPMFNFISSHLIQKNITGVEFRPIQIFSLKYAKLK